MFMIFDTLLYVVLLSGRPEVQILLATPESSAENVDFSMFSAFLIF
jgi:hypothetical protein